MIVSNTGPIIAFAGINSLSILIDKRKGRYIAEKVYGMPIIGTGGILLKAKVQKIVPAIRPLLNKMRSNGYYLADKLITQICAAAGE